MTNQELLDRFIEMCNSAKYPETVLLHLNIEGIHVVNDGNVCSFSKPSGEIVEDPASIVDGELFVGELFVGVVSNLLDKPTDELKKKLSEFSIYKRERNNDFD